MKAGTNKQMDWRADHTLSSSGRFLRNQGWLRMPSTLMRFAGLPTKIFAMMSTHSLDKCK